jgi:cytochrome d ubiquinol oxidase subunit I
MMLFSTCMVTLGTTLSVTWILVANSWMQTPAGYTELNGQFQPTNWLHVIFNPSFGIRFVHMLVGALIAAAWFIAGVSAWYLLKRRHLAVARRGVSVTLGVLALLVPVQMFIGDHVAGDYVFKYKAPQAVAMEGNWNSGNTGENFFVIPNQGGAENKWQVTVPWLGSAIAKDWSGHFKYPGLKQVPQQLRPAMLPTFYGFRLMWWSSTVMLAVAMIGIALRLRGRLYSARWFHKLVVVMVPSGVVATWAGWVLAETGRQPWLVYGKLLTAQAVSPLNAWSVLTTLILFVVIYMTLLGTYVWYVARVVREGPDEEPLAEPAAPSLRPAPLPNPAPVS